MGAGTVGELLNLPGIRFYRNRGIGQRVTRYLRHLRDQLADRLAAQTGVLESSAESADSISVDRMAQSLGAIKLPQAESAALRIWLGLEGEIATGHDLPTLRDASEAAAFSRAALQACIEQAVQKWAKNKWMKVLRDEVADFVTRREGIVTVEELGSRLLGLRGSTAPTHESRTRHVGAVIQSAVESEGSRTNARYVWHRGSSALLVVATEHLGAAFKSSALERADYAQQLGKVVSQLAAEWPLPTQRRVDEALAQVVSPDDDLALTPERRLRLAVAMAPRVALSSRLELYQHGLSAERALRLGSGALLGATRLTDKQIQSRITSRFAHAEPLPDRPALDRLLQQAEIPLEWREATEGMPAGYAPPLRSSGHTLHSSTFKRFTTLTAHHDSRDPQDQPAVLFEQTLQRAVRDGRVLIVTHPMEHLLLASQALARRFQLEPVSIDQLLIEAMHTAARNAGAHWHVVLKADCAARDSTDWRRLQALIARALPEVRQQLHDDPRALLLQNIGLLVRYGQLGLIQSLRDAAQNARRPPRIILVPGDAERAAPILDSAALPVITPADFTAMPDVWLKNRHRRGSQPARTENVA
jgi:hypothetical protein